MGVTIARHRLQQWPGPSNTGVPPGTSLTPFNGILETTSDGQLIENMDVLGVVIPSHNNVTIRRCRIRFQETSGGPVTAIFRRTGILVEDCELDGLNVASSSGIHDCNGYTVRRCNIHHCENGIDLSGNADIRDCWIHDEAGTDIDPHEDGIQFSPDAANIVIHHNFIDSSTPQVGTSGIITKQSIGNGHSNVRITGNRIWGGGVGIYLPWDPAPNFYCNYNRLLIPPGGTFYFAADQGVTWTECIGNVDDVTGAPISPI